MYSNQSRQTMDVSADIHSVRRGHARLRVVHSVPDLRVQHHVVLRGHLPGRESRTQVLSLLDEHGVLCHFHHRDGTEMGRSRLQQILRQFLDNSRLYHRFRKFRFAHSLAFDN